MRKLGKRGAKKEYKTVKAVVEMAKYGTVALEKMSG